MNRRVLAETDQLRLVPFDSSHICSEYLNALNNGDHLRYSDQRVFHHSWSSAQAYVEGFREGPHQFVAIERMGDSRLVGTLTAYWRKQARVVDLGILMFPAFSGHGYGYSAWVTFMRWLCTVGGARKITAATSVSNEGMRRIALKSGMTVEARLLAEDLIDGVPTDQLRFCYFCDEGLHEAEPSA